jgi:tetratricopeptide (TPR) repeat protein
VIKTAPSYAEAWNQRAFVRFLRDKDASALSDLEKTIELEPDHFGALAGMYHVLMRMGRTEVALSALTRAVTIHPWIQERGLLPPDPDAKRPVVKGKQQELWKRSGTLPARGEGLWLIDTPGSEPLSL